MISRKMNSCITRYRNIEKFPVAIGFKLSSVITLISANFINVIVCFIINWPLTLIMLSILPFLIGSCWIFVQVFI